MGKTYRKSDSGVRFLRGRRQAMRADAVETEGLPAHLAVKIQKRHLPPEDNVVPVKESAWERSVRGCARKGLTLTETYRRAGRHGIRLRQIAEVYDLEKQLQEPPLRDSIFDGMDRSYREHCKISDELAQLIVEKHNIHTEKNRFTWHLFDQWIEKLEERYGVKIRFDSRKLEIISKEKWGWFGGYRYYPNLDYEKFTAIWRLDIA